MSHKHLSWMNPLITLASISHALYIICSIKFLHQVTRTFLWYSWSHWRCLCTVHHEQIHEQYVNVARSSGWQRKKRGALNLQKARFKSTLSVSRGRVAVWSGVWLKASRQIKYRNSRSSVHVVGSRPRECLAKLRVVQGNGPIERRIRKGTIGGGSSGGRVKGTNSD